MALTEKKEFNLSLWRGKEDNPDNSFDMYVGKHSIGGYNELGYSLCTKKKDAGFLDSCNSSIRLEVHWLNSDEEAEKLLRELTTYAENYVRFYKKKADYDKLSKKV